MIMFYASWSKRACLPKKKYPKRMGEKLVLRMYEDNILETEHNLREVLTKPR